VTPLVELLEWDTDHFGFKVARLHTEAPDNLKEAQDICVRDNISLLISRFSTDNVLFTHELERHGFNLMDTIVKYCVDITDYRVAPVPGPAITRPCLKSEADDVAAIARDVFANYIGHFHQDTRLDRDKCTALYAEWARNSCLDNNLADTVLVAEIDGKIVGFTTRKARSAKVGEGILSGVSPEAQGQGIRKALMVASLNWSKSRGLERVDADTHVNNYIIQRVFANFGFRMHSSFYTFHKWFGGVT